MRVKELGETTTMTPRSSHLHALFCVFFFSFSSLVPRAAKFVARCLLKRRCRHCNACTLYFLVNFVFFLRRCCCCFRLSWRPSFVGQASKKENTNSSCTSSSKNDKAKLRRHFVSKRANSVCYTTTTAEAAAADCNCGRRFD